MPTETAALIPNSRFSVIGGPEFLGDAEEALAAIEAFVAKVPDETVTTAAAKLSPREAEIFSLRAKGSSNQEIADQLVLSVRTVERRITNIYGKIGSLNRAQATAYAKDTGLV